MSDLSTVMLHDLQKYHAETGRIRMTIDYKLDHPDASLTSSLKKAVKTLSDKGDIIIITQSLGYAVIELQTF